MWHFLRSKKDQFGFGKPTAESQNSSLIENAVHEMLKRLEKMYERLKKWNVKVYFRIVMVFIVILYYENV